MKDNILITGKSGFIGSKIKGGKAYAGRVEDYAHVLQQANDCVGIVHLAAKSNDRLCKEDPQGCITTNLIGTCNVLKVALDKGIWVLFISSFQFKDKSLYGMSKLVGEELCRTYQEKGVNVRIIRLPIVYGPEDKPDKIVTKLINELKAGYKPKIDTDKKFHFAYVTDVAKVIEYEVDLLTEEFGKRHTLYELVDGINLMLGLRKKGEKND